MAFSPESLRVVSGVDGIVNILEWRGAAIFHENVHQKIWARQK